MTTRCLLRSVPEIHCHVAWTFRSQEMFVGCLTSQQHASVSQGRMCSDNFTCCHTEIEVADQTFYLTQSQYTDTGPSADPITPGAWQGSHWSANFYVTGMTRPRKNPGASGIRTRDLPLSRRTPYHKANEAVSQERFGMNCSLLFIQTRLCRRGAKRSLSCTKNNDLS